MAIIVAALPISSFLNDLYLHVGLIEVTLRA